MKLVERGFPSDPVKVWKESQKKSIAVIEETDSESQSETSSVSSISGSSTSGPDYGYLLSMAILSLSKEKKDELLKQRDDKVTLLLACRSTSFGRYSEPMSTSFKLKNIYYYSGSRTYALWNASVYCCAN